MQIAYKNIILRDYLEKDIADEIRWFNKETAWMTADTPWEPIVPANEIEIENDIRRYLSSIRSDAERSRLEIETEGKHIGFVCAYSPNKDFEIQDNQIQNANKYCALGIEICEPAFWGKGLGAQALSAFIRYYHNYDFNVFYLETWSGNVRMIKCAEKLGFSIYKRELNARKVNDVNYDAIFMRLDRVC
ncbi:MAG TPA: GNAT family protein [Eubacteriales bacterium]|nr:GNAT family protein [Eubacteriales bacterium]